MRGRLADREAAMLPQMGPELATGPTFQDVLIVPDAPEEIVTVLGSVPARDLLFET